MNDMIYAFAGPAVPSAIQVLRVSGDGCAAWLDRWFRMGPLPRESAAVKASRLERRLAELPGYRAVFGYLYDPETGVPIDQAVVLRYRQPHSYTGEEMVEISLHGSMAVRRKVLETAASLGARPAEAGEFTERAFLHGKLDLTQVEAVADLIESRAERSAEQALKRLGGGLSHIYRELGAALIAVIAELQLAIDYPEHEDSILETDVLRSSILRIAERCTGLLETYRRGRALQDGYVVVLLGPPNAGKSSLLNALVQQDRAIVSDIPGTTRDTIEVSLVMDGLPIRWIDTAGLRKSEDPIEKLGIERSELAAEQADLIFYLLPKDAPVTSEILADIERYRNYAPLYVLRSKSDLQEAAEPSAASEAPVPAAIPVSVEEGTGMDAIYGIIQEAFEALGSSQSEDLLLTSVREHALLERIQERLLRLAEDVGTVPEDFLTQGLISVAEEIAQLTGEDVGEAVLNDLFGRFCVGK